MPKWSLMVMGAVLCGIMAEAGMAAPKDEAKKAPLGFKDDAKPAAGEPTSQPVDKRKQIAESKKALDAAVKDLLKELQDFDKPEKSKPGDRAKEGESDQTQALVNHEGGLLPRKDSDYFEGKTAPDGLADAALDALKDPIRGAGPRGEAYVKWQLLSALPSGRTSDDKVAQKLVAAYLRAPMPSVRSTLAPNNARMEPMLTSKTKEDVQALNRDLQAVNRQYMRANLPMLKYRDALFARLPQTPAAFEAGLKDYLDRLSVGAPTASHLTTVAGSIRGWLIVAKPNELQVVGTGIAKLQDRRGPGYYASANWDSSSNKPYWDKGGNDAEMRELADLLKQMQTQAKGGGPALKFKDE